MRTGLKIAGYVLHVMIGGFMIFAGLMKLFAMTPEMKEQMAASGLGPYLQLIAVGEIASAILLLIPQTSSLGLLLVSGFWGGVISFHMSHDGQFAGGSVFLALTWLGGWLRDHRAFYSFYPRQGERS